MTIETAASAQNVAFTPIVSFTVASGLRTDVLTAAFSKVPPARFLRWNMNIPSGASGDATFRIWLAGYRWT